MANKKESIMEAYLQLLDENSEKRITVNDIVNRCGVSRNTFYYYFSDISALMDEMQTRWAEVIRLPKDPESIMDCLTPMARFGKKHENGLLRAYQSVGSERFPRDLNRMWDAIVRRYLDTRDTSGLDAEDRELLVRFFKGIFIGMTMDWLDSGMSYDLAAAGARVRSLLKDAQTRGQLPQIL